jgi:hypothetical protein
MERLFNEVAYVNYVSCKATAGQLLVWRIISSAQVEGYNNYQRPLGYLDITQQNCIIIIIIIIA